MSAVLHITDTHIVGEGALVSGRLDSYAALERLIARIQSIRPQLGAVDAVVISGDLTDDGTPESYDRFKALLAPLELPLLVVPGNHDARDSMRAAFADQFPPHGALNWARRMGELHAIGLDTLVEGSGHGALSEATLDFLATALAQAGDAPVLLALHHPPFASGIAFMDAIGLRNQDAFCRVIAQYRGPLRVLCGHIHTMMVVDVAGHTAISGPSPCSSFAYDCRSDAPKGFMDTGDGCLLHRWEGGFRSIRISAEPGAGPFPF